MLEREATSFPVLAVLLISRTSFFSCFKETLCQSCLYFEKKQKEKPECITSDCRDEISFSIPEGGDNTKEGKFHQFETN